MISGFRFLFFWFSKKSSRRHAFEFVRHEFELAPRMLEPVHSRHGYRSHNAAVHCCSYGYDLWGWIKIRLTLVRFGRWLSIYTGIRSDRNPHSRFKPVQFLVHDWLPWGVGSRWPSSWSSLLYIANDSGMSSACRGVSKSVHVFVCVRVPRWVHACMCVGMSRLA